MVPQTIGFVLIRAVFGFAFAVKEERDIQLLIELMLQGVAASDQTLKKGNHRKSPAQKTLVKKTA